MSRSQFRIYLEKSAVIDALTKALIKLYEEPNKPENAVQYIRTYMCEDECSVEEKYEHLKSDHEETLELVEHLQEEISHLKGNIKLTDEEITQAIDEGYKQLIDDFNCKSLLKKYLTDELLLQLRSLKTSHNATILNCIRLGLENHEYEIGVCAPDAESYTIFRNLLDPIIMDLYELTEMIDSEDKVEKLQKPTNWGNPFEIKDLDPEEKYIHSITISVSRNLDGYPFTPLLSEKEFKEIEDKIRNVLNSLDEPHKGTYKTLKQIDRETYSQQIIQKIAFTKGGKLLESAGNHRFWPTGRGIFYTDTKKILLWVNAEDHIKVKSTIKSGNLVEAYEQIVSFMRVLEESLKFANNERYGYLTLCLENLGNSMNISTIMNLPNLLDDRDVLEELLMKLNFKVKNEMKRQKNDTEKDNCIEFDLKRKLGPDEFETIKLFEEGILKLIEAEQAKCI